MKPHPEPTSPGFYWAKLVHPTRMPPTEDWASTGWEPVEVSINGGEGKEYLGVAVLGVSQTQWTEDFVWGPRIEFPKDSAR